MRVWGCVRAQKMAVEWVLQTGREKPARKPVEALHAVPLRAHQDQMQ